MAGESARTALLPDLVGIDGRELGCRTSGNVFL